ncbi:hypothetical protein [uncultured Maribacter sp.]|uniref:hypothetical protein n=1 Tax=uncultured Maribacter sp. TaxID=431308 RepID=UPI00262A15E6|nr:hypothetical protein [uncultured Maribacter sp.]
MSKELPILDVEDLSRCFERITTKIDILHEAFRAMTMDYSHHIENTLGKNHHIIRLRENIDFRLVSSKFHLELLFRQYYIIEREIKEYAKKKPEVIFKQIFPSHPLFDNYEKQITSIFDSIVFHLSSIFDYLSAIINYIINNKDESITKWSQLNNSCRQKTEFNNKEVSKCVIEKHNSFVNKLYEHRTRLIHEKSDIHPSALKIELNSGKIDLRFFARKELTKKFSYLRKKTKDNRLTISFVSEWLIETTIDSIIDILRSISSDMKSVSRFPENIGMTEWTMLYRNPETGIGEPVSDHMWREIEKKITAANNGYN